MTRLKLLTATVTLVVLTGCANPSAISNTNYENATQSLLSDLPNDADRTQPARQLELMAQGRYLTVSGGVLNIPRNSAIAEQSSDSFVPNRRVEHAEKSDKPTPVRIRVVDDK